MSGPRRAGPEWFRRAVATVVRAVLVAAIVVGGVRELRSRIITGALVRRIATEVSADAIEGLVVAVAARFRDVNTNGPVTGEPPWMVRTAADALLLGGACGQASEALGAVLAQRGIPFRLLQVNVGTHGASHVMLESLGSDGRWLLFDPIVGRAFRDPHTGRLVTFDEIRAQGPGGAVWLDAPYHAAWSLYGPYRRTNWARVPLVGAWLEHSSLVALVPEAPLRALVLEPGGEIAVLALAALLAMELSTRLRPQRATYRAWRARTSRA